MLSKEILLDISMAIAELIANPVPEIVLLVGGFLALLIGIVGKSDKTSLDEIAVFLAFFVGLFMIVLAILIAVYGDQPTSTMLVMGILGMCLFSRAFKKIKWAFIISVLIAGVLALLLHLLATNLSIGFLTPTVILIIAFVAFIILFLILKAIETTFRFLGGAISFRPIMFIGGILAIIEGVLLFMGSSLSAVFG